MKQLITQSLLVIALFCAVGVTAQTPFWTEDFDGSLPTGWTSVDASNQSILWVWCNGAPTCAPVFTGRSAFASETAANGFAVANSDASGADLPTNHISRLTTTAINCTGKANVFINFNTEIGTFAVDADPGAKLRVSTNGTTWTEYLVFPGLTGAGSQWSDNPAIPTIDISATAANQATVYLQWQWTGNWEYLWSLDDVKLFSENPTPRHDLSITSHFYPVSSFATPVSQIATDTFGFFATVSNTGSLTQTKVKLKVTVEASTGTVLYSDSTIIASLASGVLDSTLVIDSQFAPEVGIGEYFITYTLTADSTDQRPSNNVVFDPFIVTNAIFSKENGVVNANRPASTGDWAIGNLYTMSKNSLENYQAVAADFTYAVGTAGPAIETVSAAINLYRVNDGVLPDYSNFNGNVYPSDSTTWVGTASYTAPDTMVNFALQSIALEDLVGTGGTNGVPLDKGARYFLLIEYTGVNNTVLHGLSDIVAPTFVNTMVIDIDNDNWFLGGFGDDVNAVLRMVLGLVSSTDEQPLADNTMSVFPNPVKDVLNLGMNFEVPTNATITIADLNGRVITFQDRDNLTNETVTYPVNQLAAGTYLARIATAAGTLTKKFVVVK